MTLNDLAIFVDVMRLGSFAAAARRRDLDPSSVSRLVAGLETELGFRLFQRSTRRLAATEAGARYFERVAPLVADLARAEQEARDLVAQPSGLLRVSAPVSFGLTHLVPLLPGLRAAYPDMVVEMIFDDAMVDLLAGGIDVAVRLGPRQEADLVGTLVMQTHYRVCASPDYLTRAGPIAVPSQLAAHGCLVFPIPGFRSAWRFRDGAGAESTVPVTPAVVLSSGLALRQAALDGLGPALLADWLVSEDVAAGRLVDLFPEFAVTATDFETAVWVLYPSRAYVPQKTRVFIDYLKAQIRPRTLGR